jgi:hypothetical protein
MGKIHVHVHKRTADAAEPQASEKQALIRDFMIKTDSKDRAVALQYLRAKSWDLDRAVQGWERLNKTADHRLDFKPDTDADRRARIQEVMRACDVTHMVALRWLEAEEWITDTTIRELKHAMKLGFTVDSAVIDAYDPSKNASWVIKEKATGRVIMETFDPAKVKALNTVKYEAVPILKHLVGLNSK